MRVGSKLVSEGDGRVKVSCITSVIGIVFWLLTWLTCQLSSYFSQLVLLDSLHKPFVQCW